MSKQSLKLLTWGLTKFDTIRISKKDKIFSELEVWQGKKNKVKVHTKEDIYKTIKKAQKKYLKVTIKYDGPVKAPINKNDIVGKVIISFKDDLLSEHDLYSSEKINRQNIFSRILSSINFLIWGDV